MSRLPVRLGAGLALLAVAAIAFAQVEEFLPKPPKDPRPANAQIAFDAGRYEQAAEILQDYIKDQPTNADAWFYLGWSRYRLGRFAASMEAFEQAESLTPDSIDVQVALGYAALQLTGPRAAADYFGPVIEAHPERRDALEGMVLAGRRAGAPDEIVQAAAEAARLLETREGKDIETLLASTDLRAGEEKLLNEEPLTGPLHTPYRAGGTYLEQRDRDGAWGPIFVKGVNLNAALPGRTHGELPTDEALYLDWLAQIAQLGANTVRVTSLMPPAFYAALGQHNEATEHPTLWLIQGIWADPPPENDFFDPGYAQKARAEILRTINAVHGNVGIGPRASHSWGAYERDVSGYVLAFVYGQPWSPETVQDFNALYPNEHDYPGRWVSVEDGAAMEVWLGRMLDEIASYESDQYRVIRPLAFINWPTLDPLYHPTEATLAEENELRAARGLPLLTPEEPWDDDAVSVDAMRIVATESMPAGVFAAYSVFPNTPDFMLNEYQDAADERGPNPFFGYLRALTEYHAGQPVLITEFGLSTSQGIAHVHPYGWHHGGIDELTQGRLLGRMMANIHASQCAGGVIFSLLDEWYRSTWNTTRYEIREQAPNWFNAESPAQAFGLLAVRPGSSAIRIDGDRTDWGNTPTYLAD